MDPPIRRRKRKLGSRIRHRHPIKRIGKRPPLSKVRDLLAKDHGLFFDPHGTSYAVPIDRLGLTPTATRIAVRIYHMTQNQHAPRDRRYPWDRMEHGDSFVVKTPGERRAARTSLIAYLKTKKCHLKGTYFMVSEAQDGAYRCFLVNGEALPLAKRQTDFAAHTIEKNHPIPVKEDEHVAG